ncbi:MAG TPA: transcriptional regulator NrdR [Candidatus Omnitrophica bacterium]|nr:MAG: transcriptional regulator NrdR [Omnitrophica WOR_2 bacterium GWA2_63_20]OGX32841.1 MAG: transcriptional regulator NrdR [Omnitrophica WOR_2 bacterium RIFCSPHIGHO2_12_FULL_64_13]OGX35602.1 MAG: transcriptional regulator NrdR [Omnitrophica WOR_2 bacterium RIFCSPHIGHO2_02_FULL_63_39]OGX46312.1 MAG: transcriptional regulator NrdR [Omnitrophica WOR_2 bacterium RIFCSPLOWO2_02_FULL_63_16]OGX47091.1 MAG: transcriptional regulator NrdR [Omnitrophica WOR_2 bacterium RIFCSPLOWO2_12_FULL_63_16]HBH9
MTCPFCGHPDHKVVDSRTSADGQAIRRRRECLSCGKRFTTYEHLEEQRLMVIKKDGRREPFDRNKLLAGFVKACEKRPVSMDQLEDLADEIERDLSRTFEHEVPSQEIGERVMRRLHDVDPVAYVRFASVYREFKDVEQFMRELKDVLAKQTNPGG